MDRVQWSWACTLVASNARPYKGTLRQAVTRWDNLPARLRPSAYIELDVPIDGQTRLSTGDLQSLVRRPDFLQR